MAQDRTTGHFKAEEGLSRDQQAAIRRQRLAETVKQAYAQAPAVKAKLDSVGAKPEEITSLADLERLPITEKSDLVRLQAENPPFGGFVTLPREKLRRVFASPGPIYEPWPMDYEDPRWAEAMFAAGFRPGDAAAVTFSFHLAPFGFMLDASLKMLGVTSLPTGVGNTELQVGIFKDLGVNAVCATPSFVHAIAHKAREMGLDPGRDLNLSAAFVAAEMLPESLRSELEADFGMTVRQAYGTADIGCLGYECFHKGGMHFPVDCIVEIVDPETGKRLGPGEMGEVAATCFDPLYPLIRFGTGDLSSYVDEPCDCGRTAPKLTRIMGRVDQVTKVKGMFVHPGQVDQVGARFDSLSAWRVVVTRSEQRDLMTFQVELKTTDLDREKLAGEIKAALKDVLRLKGEVEFVSPGTIPPDSKKVADERVWD